MCGTVDLWAGDPYLATRDSPTCTKSMDSFIFDSLAP
jgi:hypothetical protein